MTSRTVGPMPSSAFLKQSFTVSWNRVEICVRNNLWPGTKDDLGRADTYVVTVNYLLRDCVGLVSA